MSAREAMAARCAARLPDADVQVIVPPGPRKGNLVARLRGTRRTEADTAARPHRRGRGEARGLERDPFKLIEEDGYFYGRGTVDDKAMAAIFVANLIEPCPAGYKPDRDIILALTADEELSTRRTTARAGCWRTTAR